jgi:hypothetical protein
MSFQDFVDKAKENREKFLAKYKKKFDALDPLIGRRKRAKIIVDLIKAEPSHIDEFWIRREVERWLLDPNCRDYLDAIKPPTEKSRLKMVRDTMIFDRVENLMKQGVGVTKACQKLAINIYMRDVDNWLTLSVKDEDSQLDEKIRKIYYREKERRETQLKPYYGRDIRVEPRG